MTFSPLKIISKTKESLFTYNDQPFTGFSVFMIILLDVFIFITIMYGIRTEQLNSPDVYIKYPSSCIKHFNIDKPYQKENFIRKYPLAEYKDFNDFRYPSVVREYGLSEKDKRIMSPICKKLDKKISKFRDSYDFRKNLKKKNSIEQELLRKKNAYNTLRKRYNTKLFEKTAGIPESLSIDNQKNQYYSILNEIEKLEKQISQIKPVKDYAGYSEYKKFVRENSKILNAEYKSYVFWQPFYKFLYLLKFILPLFFIAFLINRWSGKIGEHDNLAKRVLNFISKHIIFILSLPLFVNVMTLIYHIIPHRFFGKIIKFLYDFGVLFLGYYFLVFIGILFFGTLIFFIQRSYSLREKARKKIKEKNKYKKAYNTGECPNCNNKIDYINSEYCLFCGEGIKKICIVCKTKTIKNMNFCMHCGQSCKKQHFAGKKNL